MKRLLMILVVCLALAGVAAMAGCGGSTTAAPGDTTAAESAAPEGEQGSGDGATVTVDMQNTAFDPADVEVAPGDTVEWVNDDDFAHNVVADSGADFESDDFGKGGTFEWKATEPGTVKYECTIHPGMTGRSPSSSGRDQESLPPDRNRAVAAPVSKASELFQSGSESI